MLTFFTGASNPDCEGVSRRDFIRIGSLGLGALGVEQLLSTQALASGSDGNFLKGRSVVFLYLSGGASHIETFNPNMDAPSPYSSLTGEISTSVPGLTFGGNFPLLAKHAHRMSIIRSFRSSVGSHEQAHVHILSGGTDPRGDTKTGQSIGSLYTRARGNYNPESGLPTYALLTSEEIDGQYRKELNRVIKGSWPGQFGSLYSPFEVRQEIEGKAKKKSKRSRKKKNSSNLKSGSFLNDLKLHLDVERLKDRRSLLEKLDGMKRSVDSQAKEESLNKLRAQAYDLILQGATAAFDVKNESPKTIERYDTSHVQVGHKVFRKSSLGMKMLLARRLCEAGCGFVTVHSAGWDMHADGNNPGMVKGMNMLGPTVDQSVSTFLTDIEERGLSDKILLVITGDFGRTPKVNKKGGRDHWARLCTLAFAGGGLKPGVVGRSDRQNGEPASNPINPENMMGTILHSVFDVGQMRVARNIPREVMQLVDNSPPIKELF